MCQSVLNGLHQVVGIWHTQKIQHFWYSFCNAAVTVNPVWYALSPPPPLEKPFPAWCINVMVHFPIEVKAKYET